MATHSTPSQIVGEAERQIRNEPRAKSTPAASAPHAAGMLWFAGWLFTVGFAKLVWWKAIFGLILWPYFLGTTIR